MTYVLGVDPGGTTGLCLLRVPEHRPAEVMELLEVPDGTEGFIARWWGMHDWPHHIVCEAFNLDGRTPKPDLTPVEIIGVLKGWHGGSDGNYSVGKLTFQTNTQGKHLMTNDVLKRAGYYPERGKVGGGHACDALRHSLTYVVKTLKHKPTIQKLYPQEA